MFKMFGYFIHINIICKLNVTVEWLACLLRIRKPTSLTEGFRGFPQFLQDSAASFHILPNSLFTRGSIIRRRVILTTESDVQTPCKCPTHVYAYYVKDNKL
jgi:hypothetical protein